MKRCSFPVFCLAHIDSINKGSRSLLVDIPGQSEDRKVWVADSGQRLLRTLVCFDMRQKVLIYLPQHRRRVNHLLAHRPHLQHPSLTRPPSRRWLALARGATSSRVSGYGSYSIRQGVLQPTTLMMLAGDVCRGGSKPGKGRKWIEQIENFVDKAVPLTRLSTTTLVHQSGSISSDPLFSVLLKVEKENYQEVGNHLQREM